MARIIQLTDFACPELDVYARLTEPQLRSRLEPEMGIFIAESPKVISQALAAGCKPLSFLMEHRRLSGPVSVLLEQCGDVPVYVGARALLEQLTGYALTRGVLCALRRPPLPEWEQICNGVRRLVVLENVVDAVNVGAIFRAAAALNVDAVLLGPSCCDPLSRRALRVSMGTVFQIPWAYAGADGSGWPRQCFDRLREQGFRVAAMALRGDKVVRLDDPELAAEPKLAIVLGNEGEGLPLETIAASDYTVRIPMSGGVDSLNVAAAGAVAFWQLCALHNAERQGEETGPIL